ncbi:MAG: phage tail tape measure protein [Mariprofundus sp.]|nr:phage tail tape measure protein [Mariprofundus sp.]
MALQDLGIGLVIGGAIAASFKTSFKTANTSIGSLDKHIKGLNKTKLDIKSFKGLSKDALKNKTSLDKMGLSLKKSGVDVRHLDKDSRLLRRSLVKLKQASKINIKLTANKAAFAEQKASIMGIGASLYGVTRIIKSANNVLKAQGEIKSLGISTEGIDAITKAGLNMSLQFGQITAPEFIKASYDIKSGIASLSDEGVKDLTKFAAVTAVATKSSTAEMTKLYALGYGIFREDFTSDLDFGKQFSGAIAGAVQAFRTDGSDLSAGLSNIGASAKSMGVSLSEELAIIGLSKGSFASASEAGSGYRAFLDGASKAQEKLGLNFTDSVGKMLPMADILGLLKNKFGDVNFAENAQLKEAFGSSEAIKTISALLPKIDALKQAEIGLKKSMAGGMSKSQEMALAMDMGYGFEKMSNALGFLSFTVGKAVAPAIDALASGLGGLAKGVAWLDNKIPFLIPVFSGLALGVMGLVVALKVATLSKLAFQFAALSVRKSILLSTASNLYHAMSFNRIGAAAILARGKLMAYAIGSKIATGAQWLFNAALTANPIGLVIAGVSALAAGAYLLYDNWSAVTQWFGDKLDWLTSKFDFVGDAWNSIFGDEEKTLTQTVKQVVKPAAGLMGAVALSSGLAMAQAMPQAVNFPVQQPSTVKPHQLTKQEQVHNNQKYNINVVVHNPSSNVDVESAIVSAIKKQATGVSLHDEDI